MTKKTKASLEPDTIDETLQAWDRLIQAFDSLPNDEAKVGFLEYAQAVLDFSKLRRYLTGIQTEEISSPLHGMLFSMKLDDERLWEHSKAGKDELATKLVMMFQALSGNAERVAFAQFADAVIGYHITKNETSQIDWRDWSM